MVIIEQPCRINDTVKIVSQDVKIGCYTTIHENTLIYGDAPIKIGRCCWIGRNVVLNATASLTIGNGCVISANAGIYTHMKGGNVLLGSRYNWEREVVLGDEVWIGVGSVVAKSLSEGTYIPNNNQLMLPPYTTHLENKVTAPESRLLMVLKALGISEEVISIKETLTYDMKHWIWGSRKIYIIEDGTPNIIKEVENDGFSVFNCFDLTFTFNKSRYEEQVMWELLKNQMKFYPRYV